MVLLIQPMELLAIFVGWGTKPQGPSHRAAPSLSIPSLCHRRGSSVPGSAPGTCPYSVSQGSCQPIPPARSGLWNIAWLPKVYRRIFPNLLFAQLVSACSITSSRSLTPIQSREVPVQTQQLYTCYWPPGTVWPINHDFLGLTSRPAFHHLDVHPPTW